MIYLDTNIITQSSLQVKLVRRWLRDGKTFGFSRRVGWVLQQSTLRQEKIRAFDARKTSGLFHYASHTCGLHANCMIAISTTFQYQGFPKIHPL